MPGVNWGELAAKRTRCLGGKGRPGGRCQPPIVADGETVDAPRCGVGGPDLDADEIRPRRVEQDVAWVGSVRQLDRGPAQRNESSALREPESGVVAARSGEFVTFVGHVNQATVNPDADRFETARPDGISNRGQ